MSTQPVYAHLSDSVLACAHRIPHGVVFLDEGVRVANHDAHSNYPVTFSRDGKALFRDSYGHTILVDMRRPAEPRRLHKGITVIHPDGQHGVAVPFGDYPYKAPDGAEVVGHLVKVALETGEIVERWPTAGLVPRRVHVFGGRDDDLPDYKKERWRAPTQGILHGSKELELAGDDQDHWALVGTERLVIGRGPSVLCDVYWFGWSFYPPAGVIDLDRERVYVAGERGIVAFSFNGDVEASWWSKLPEAGPYTPLASVQGPVLVQGDELLAVTHVGSGTKTYGAPQKYVVRRFAADTLELLGSYEGFKPRQLADGASRLLASPGGALLWVPLSGAVAVDSPAPWSFPRTDEMYVVGDEPPPRFAHAANADPSGEDLVDLQDATPNQLLALARLLLETGQRDTRFQSLALQHPEAFRPWADAVLRLPDALAIALHDMDRYAFYWVTQGASDDAVDACAERISGDHGGPLTPADRARVLLLCGVLTPHALAILGELGRANPKVRSLMWDHHLETLPEGPAVVRFTLQPQAIVAADAADPLFQTGRALTATASLCHKPAQHLLSIDLSEHPTLADSPLTAQPYLLCGCERCDAWIENDHWHFDADGIASTPPREDACPGDGQAPLEPKLATLGPIATREFRRLGVLGGRAQWWQQPDVPGCPTCGRMMFFVGQVSAGRVRDDMPDAGLWGFHCERCGQGVQVMQIT